MGAVDTTYTFTATDTITSLKMNNIIDQTTITGDAISGTTLEVTSGKLKVRSQGVTSNELATNAVTETKITDGSVTPVKLSIGKVTWGSDYTDIGYGVSGTYYASLTPSRSGDGNTTLSFGSQTGVNNGASITRESGANGNLVISNTGTGSIKFNDISFGAQSGIAPIYGARAFAKCNPIVGVDNSQAFKNGSYSAAVGTVVTVTIVNHNLKANDKIRLVFTRTSGTGTVPSSSTVFNVVSKISNDVFTVAFTSAAISTGTVVAWFVKVDSSQNISSVTFYDATNSSYVFNFDVPMPTSDFSISGAGQYYPGSWVSTIAEYNSPGTVKLNTVNNAYIASSHDSRFISVIIFA